MPVDDSYDRIGSGGCCWNCGPETVEDTLLVDVGLVPSTTEVNDAQTLFAGMNETAINAFDRVGVGGAQGDTAVEVVARARVLLALDRDEDLTSFLVLAGDTPYSRRSAWSRASCRSRSSRVRSSARSVFSALLIFVPPVCCTVVGLGNLDEER